MRLECEAEEGGMSAASVWNMTLRKHCLSLLMLVLSIGGCATTQETGNKRLLDFLVDGQTSKQEVILALGQPSGVYENESVYTYRIVGDSSTGFKPSKSFSPCGWHDITYSLVVIFDDQDVLKRHSLVPIQ